MTVNTKLVDFFFLKAPKRVGFASFLTKGSLSPSISRLCALQTSRSADSGWLCRINSGIIYTKESHYFFFPCSLQIILFYNVKIFWVMVGMGTGISNDQDQFPFHGKDKAVVSKAAACAGGWDGSSEIKSPALQKICWRAF